MVSIALMAGSANADNHDGYPCQIQFIPANFETPGDGSYGMIFVNLYTGGFCSGDYVATARICSTGATDPQCVWKLDEIQLAMIYNGLIEAGQGRKWNCNGYTQNCSQTDGLLVY
jgi:hypothetical protein